MHWHPIYEFFRARYRERSANFPWELDDKLIAKKFVAAHAAVPETLAIATERSAISEICTPDRCVIKPNGLHSAHGVFALVKLKQDSWLNLLGTPSIISDSDWKKVHSENWDKSAGHNRRIPYSVFVEDFIVSAMGQLAIPLDVKIYCIRGRAVLGITINRNFPRPVISFFKPDWSPADGWLSDCFVTKGSQLPMHPEQATETAEKLARLLDTPFVSVDLLEGVDGPYFGEFTPAPGGAFAWALKKRAMWQMTDHVLDQWQEMMEYHQVSE